MLVLTASSDFPCCVPTQKITHGSIAIIALRAFFFIRITIDDI